MSSVVRPAVLISAPGAGLGHLVRATALVLRLRERGCPARIVTNSPYAPGLSQLAGCEIDQLPNAEWSHAVVEYVKKYQPEVLVLDSFPFGLRREWEDGCPGAGRVVYLARRLHLPIYLEAVNKKEDTPLSHLSAAIVVEPLAEEHEAWLKRSSLRLFRLAGPLRLPENFRSPEPPPQLQELLDDGRLWLIVHTGPENELHLLLAHARAEMERWSETADLALLTARRLKTISLPVFEFFPARELFPIARRIVSAAGYNLMAEMSRWPDKHLPVPLPRHFDDQAGRLAAGPMSPADGTLSAADYIMTLLADKE